MANQEPLTDQLLDELLASPSAESFLETHTLPNKTLSQLLQEYVAEKGLERSKVIRDAQINDTHGYQIFMGSRGASRDKVLQLALAMGLTLKETSRLLHAAGANPLYVKKRRDAIITFCLNKGCSLQETNEQLYEFGEDILG
ncbi:MAG: XRE family transcriptional regulator [Anaerotardibacter sp.]